MKSEYAKNPNLEIVAYTYELGAYAKYQGAYYCNF